MTAPTYDKLTPPRQGTRVTVDANGRWKVPEDPIICLLRGDGIGRDVGLIERKRDRGGRHGRHMPPPSRGSRHPP